MSERRIKLPVGGLGTLTPACPTWCESQPHAFDHDDVVDLSRRRHVAQHDTLWRRLEDFDEQIPVFCVDLVMDEMVRGRELWTRGPWVNAYDTGDRINYDADDLRKMSAMLLDAADKLDELSK